jgi:hypothetical protein
MPGPPPRNLGPPFLLFLGVTPPDNPPGGTALSTLLTRHQHYSRFMLVKPPLVSFMHSGCTIQCNCQVSDICTKVPDFVVVQGVGLQWHLSN